jgi:hypothetical protein
VDVHIPMVMLLFVVLVLSFRNDMRTKNIVHGFRKNHSFVIKPKNTEDYPCPPVNPDGDNCGLAFQGALDAIPDDNDWGVDGKTTLTSAIDNYVSECSASKCQANCPEVASNNALSVTPNEVVFTACKPADDPLITAPITTTECSADASNTDPACSEAYQGVLTATTPDQNGLWNGGNVKTSIGAYVTACRKSACNDQCTAVISQKNVQNIYTKLKEDFEANCDPSSGSSSSGSSSSGSSSSGSSSSGSSSSGSSSSGSSSSGSSSSGSSSSDLSSVESYNDTDLPDDNGQGDGGLMIGKHNSALFMIIFSLVILHLANFL